MTDDVTCYETLFAQFLSSQVACQTMQVNTNDAGILRLVTTCQQTCQYACQDIATTSGSHTGITSSVEDDMSVRTADGRIMTLQNDIAFQTFSQMTCLGQSLVGIGRVTFQAVELLGVGGHDDALGQLLHPGTMVGQDVKRIGIDH